MNRAVRGKEHRAFTANFNDEEAFAGHEAAHEILHLSVYLDTGGAGKKAVFLNVELVRAV
ncbi:hypothetical protein D3C85_1839260 [compost metagenome]